MNRRSMLKAAAAGVAGLLAWLPKRGMKPAEVFLTNSDLGYMLPDNQHGAVYVAEMPKGADVCDVMWHPDLPKVGVEDEWGDRVVRKTASRMDGSDTTWRIEVVWEQAHVPDWSI